MWEDTEIVDMFDVYLNINFKIILWSAKQITETKVTWFVKNCENTGSPH